MKNIILTFSFLILGFQSIGQVDPKQTEAYKIAERQYHQGIKYNDISIAKASLYTLISINPEDYSLKDSLSYIYFDYKQYTSSALICLDILNKYPNYLPALEMAAISFETMGLLDKALENYETLYLRNNNVYTLYKSGYLQYQLKKYQESLISIDAVIIDKGSIDLKLTFPITETEGQEVPLRAAAHNMKGMIYLAINETEKARLSFNEALVLLPDFKVAKDNLASIKK